MGPDGNPVPLCLRALAVAVTDAGLTADTILPRGAETGARPVRSACEVCAEACCEACAVAGC